VAIAVATRLSCEDAGEDDWTRETTPTSSNLSSPPRRHGERYQAAQPALTALRQEGTGPALISQELSRAVSAAPGRLDGRPTADSSLQPIVGVTSTVDGRGYWLVASDGGIFTYGDARFYGSAGNIHLNQPIVGMTSTADGRGYWLVASDGGIFTYGDARFYGSAGNIHLNQPIVGMTRTLDGHGYWIVATDGGLFAYGDAKFYGSLGGVPQSIPVIGLVANPSEAGYNIVNASGTPTHFGP
jgi:hypothetical protein